MAYKISSADPSVMTTEELNAELEGFVELAVEVAARLSLILAELRKRRKAHPFFYHPVLKFFQFIADGALHPEAAIILGNQDLIRAIIPLPHQRQLEVAYGAEIPVSVIADDGKIKSDDMPIQRMDTATLRRAFGPDGIRTVHQQAEMIRKEGKIERHGMITVMRDEGLIRIGNQKIRPEDLRGPLRALGYSLDLTRNQERAETLADG